MTRTSAHLGLAAVVLGGALLASASSARAQGIGVDTLERMLVPTQRKIQRGAKIYDNQCAGCHGPQGSGDVTYPNPDKYKNSAPNFQQGEFRYGGGPIQIYNAITFGLPGADTYHPVYPPQQLRYQERWAVTHYVRSLVPKETREQLTDPPEVVEEARQRARVGVCKPKVRTELQSTIGKFLEPGGEEQMQTAEKLYANNCQSCHGKEGKGEGPAGAALNPPPRNFHDKNAEWTNGTSPLAIYNTLLNGISGTSMAAYPNMSAEERWALTHYVRKWIPESKREKTTEQDIVKLCRSRSAPPAPDPIPVDRARKAIISDATEQRDVRLRLYGTPTFAQGADPDHGATIYKQNCAGCHGGGLQGASRGPYGVQPPFFQIRVRPLSWRHAGGTYRDFARRSIGGVHASLVDAPNSAMLSDEEWQDLHAFVGTYEAPETIQVPAEKAEPTSDSAGADNRSESHSGSAGSDTPADDASADRSSNNASANGTP